MAQIADFPIPANDGPLPTNVLDALPEYRVAMTQYEDGGVDTNLSDEDAATWRWEVQYTGLTPTEHAALDAHIFAAKCSQDACSHHWFDFIHPYTGVTWERVRYDKGGAKALQANKRWAQNRSLVLVQFPG